MDLDSDDFFDPRIRNVIVLDDLMSTAATAVDAAAAAVAVVAAVVAFHFPFVGPAEVFYSLGNAPEMYHRRFPNVLIVSGPQYYYCSSQIHPDDTDTSGLYCLYYFKRRHGGMELPDIVKDFSTVDLKEMHCNCRYDRMY